MDEEIETTDWKIGLHRDRDVSEPMDPDSENRVQSIRTFLGT